MYTSRINVIVFSNVPFLRIPMGQWTLQGIIYYILSYPVNRKQTPHNLMATSNSKRKTRRAYLCHCSHLWSMCILRYHSTDYISHVIFH